MPRDYILNGRPAGEVATAMYEGGGGFDPGLWRPYLDEKGRPCVTVNTGKPVKRKDRGGNIICNDAGKPILFPGYQKQLLVHRQQMGLPCPVTNATMFPKFIWENIDQVVGTALRKELTAYADLRAAGQVGGFDAYANPIIEWERVTDAGEAVTDMDGMSDARNFAPKYEMQGMPLPLTHADFWLSDRFLQVSKKRGTPQDTIRVEMASQRCGELVEQTTLGVVEGDTYGDSTDYSITSKVYGYLNHPDRLIKNNLVVPDGTNGPAVLTSWLQARKLLTDQGYKGPFTIYLSDDWDIWLDNLFVTTEPAAGTLRQKLSEIAKVSNLKTSDWLDAATYPYTAVWVDMSPENVKAINGMEFTTIQWPSMAGFRHNFKIIGIQVPWIRARYTSRVLGATTTTVGILQATTS